MMMKKVSIILALLLVASAANATVLNNALKKKLGIKDSVTAILPPVVTETPLPTVLSITAPVVVQNSTPPVVESNTVLSKKDAKKTKNTPALVPAPETKTQASIPEQFFVIFTEETKQIINDIVNCVDEPNGGGHDNVSAVPVPAALPLMATALGIFGITRRRKAFK